MSEFGVSSWSSFESMSATLSEGEWGLHGSGDPDVCVRAGRYTNVNICTGENVLAERNYVCDSHVLAFFGPSDFETIGEEPFQEQLFQCLMSTTLWLKGQIEIIRATNSFGALIWQLNENWPTGGWGVLEYGSGPAQPGQSIGGRWKPMMHILKTHLFRDLFATCGQNGECYFRNDSNEQVSVEIVLDYYDIISGALLNTSMVSLSEFPGDGHVGKSTERPRIVYSKARPLLFARQRVFRAHEMLQGSEKSCSSQFTTRIMAMSTCANILCCGPSH